MPYSGPVTAEGQGDYVPGNGTGKEAFARLKPELWLLDPAVVHLNHGSYGAVPTPVLEAQRCAAERIERSPERFYRADLGPAMDDVRGRVAGFLRTEATGLALVQNATEAVQVVLQSLDLQPGAQIVFTDHTYWWVQTAIARACDTYGAVPRTVRVREFGDPVARDAALVSDIVAAITPRTALVVLDQITSASALRLPVDEVITAVGSSVPVLIDGAHAPGVIERPVPAGAAFWLGNLHKWAFAARTAAALVVAPEWRQRVRPLVSSAGQADGFPGSFSYLGTQDPTAYLALPAALAFPEEHLQLSFTQLGRRNTALLEEGLATVAQRLGVPPAVPNGLPLNVLDLGREASPDAAAELTHRLREDGVEVALTSVAGRLNARVSAQAYVGSEDFAVLAEALHRELG